MNHDAVHFLVNTTTGIPTKKKQLLGLEQEANE